MKKCKLCETYNEPNETTLRALNESAKNMKKDITKIFNELKKFGFTVINNNTPTTQRRQQKGWVDYVIYNDKQIVFIEVKLEKDKLSPGQFDTMLKLKGVSGYAGNVDYYLIHDETEAKNLVDYLLEAR